MLQHIKHYLRDQVGLPPSAVLIIAGLVVHYLLNVLLRKPVTSPWGLIAPLVLGIALESYEIWVQYRDVGLFYVGNDPLIIIFARHSVDVMIVLSAPLVLVAIGRLASTD